MENSTPLISIIVPVYNVENYLHECLDSIINQTYSNLDIILIDDGSKDDSGKMCDDFAVRDPRIRVIHKENQGLAQARNSGIRVAQGDYIMFVDSDDWLDVRICEVLIDAIGKYNVQSSMCAYIKEYPNRSIAKILHEEAVVFSGKEFQRKLCGPIGSELKNPQNLDCYNSMWGKLYPKLALEGKNVTNTSVIGPAEDLLYNFSLFSDIESIVYIGFPYYHYRKNVEKSITEVYKSALEEQFETLYSKMYDIIEEKKLGEFYHTALRNRIAVNTLGIGLNSFQDGASFFEKYKRIKKINKVELRKNALKELQLNYMPIHWKLFFFSAKHDFSLFLCVLLSVIKKLRGKL